MFKTRQYDNIYILDDNGEEEEYHLEKKVARNALEEADILNDREEQEVGNAGMDGFGQAVQGRLLLQPFCFEIETYVRHYLIVYAGR